MHGLNLKQTFSFYVGGSGRCSNSQEISLLEKKQNLNGSDNYEEHLKLDINLMIYSNFEQTLSFLIRLSFDSINIQSKKNNKSLLKQIKFNFFYLLRQSESGRLRGGFSQ